jgi:tetratricopeptide (TPR) repeat protein
MLWNNKEFEKADLYFMKSSQKDPENCIIYVHRAMIQINLNGINEKALQLINKAIEVDDKCEHAYRVLGSIEVQRYNYILFIYIIKINTSISLMNIKKAKVIFSYLFQILI